MLMITYLSLFATMDKITLQGKPDKRISYFMNESSNIVGCEFQGAEIAKIETSCINILFSWRILAQVLF